MPTLGNVADVIDSHFHIWTQDNGTPEKRAERADQVRRQAERFGIDRICLIGERSGTVEACREDNRVVANYVEEHPDLFYGWARVDPNWGDEAVAEFRRAVEEDGLVGLKLYADVLLDDPAVHPLAEAAVEMDVPIISHVAHLHEHDNPNESGSDEVVGLAERYPDLKLISAHIGGGGVWEYRIKNLVDHDNVYLDTSGSVTNTGMLETAVDRLGADRLVFGTDTWVMPGVGKLEGADLTPDEKATIAYNFESLVGEHVPNKLDPAAAAAGEERARERFEALAEPRPETIVDANAFLGACPFRPVASDAESLEAEMDRVGVDRAVVSSAESVWYRNPQHGNHELAERVAGREDRFVPLATIDPTYPEWEADLDTCLDELGMRGVKLLPLYHDYALSDPAVVSLLDRCAERDVPVFFAAALEDQRGRHPRVRLRDGDDLGASKHFSEAHVEALTETLLASPEADVVVADAWTGAARIHEAVTEVTPNGVHLENGVRTGETLFVVDDLFCYFDHQAADVADEVGVENLVCGPRLPRRTFEAHYINTRALPVDEEGKDAVRSGNVLALFE